jgi:hypothetical protein
MTNNSAVAHLSFAAFPARLDMVYIVLATLDHDLADLAKRKPKTLHVALEDFVFLTHRKFVTGH